MSELEASFRALAVEVFDERVARLRLQPLTISQETVRSVLGIKPRSYLNELRKTGFPLRVIRHGKLRIVDAGEFVEYLRAKSAAESESKPEPRKAERSEADLLLEEIGYEDAPKRRVSGKARRAA